MQKLMNINKKLSIQVLSLTSLEKYDTEDKMWFLRTRALGLNPTLFTLKKCDQLFFDLVYQQCEEFNLLDLDNYFIIGTYPFNAHNVKEETSFKSMILENLTKNKFKSVEFGIRS